MTIIHESKESNKEVEVEKNSRMRPLRKRVPTLQVQAEGWPEFYVSNGSKTVYGTEVELGRISSVNIWKFSSNCFYFPSAVTESEE